MRRVNPGCINLILTGYPAFESALQALRQQVDDYLTKPAGIPMLLDTIARKLNERRKPSSPQPIQRLSAILRDNMDTIMSRTLMNLKASPALAALQLSDEELLGNIRAVLMQLAEHLDSDFATECNEALMQFARERGRKRLAQHFPLDLLVEKFRILQAVVNNVIYENLLLVNLSYLLLDLNRLNDALMLQLEQSVKAYVEAERTGAGATHS